MDEKNTIGNGSSKGKEKYWKNEFPRSMEEIEIEEVRNLEEEKGREKERGNQGLKKKASSNQTLRGILEHGRQERNWEIQE